MSDDDDRALERAEIGLETLDSLRAVDARIALLASAAERDRLRNVDLTRELSDLRALVNDVTRGFHELLDNDPDAALNPSLALIVDDDAGFANALRRRLSTKGVRAFHEAEPTEAARTFAVVRPATVFVDVMMPGRKGTLVASDIKEVAPDAVVVLVTGFLNVENAFDGGYVGADFIVEKGEMEPLLMIAQGQVPSERVITAAHFATEDEARRRHAQHAVERFGSRNAGAEALGVDVRTLNKLLDD